MKSKAPFAALEEHLAKRGVSLERAEPTEGSDETNVTGSVWRPVSVPGFDALKNVLVQLPVSGRATLDAHGAVKSVAVADPSDDDIDEARAFVQTLATHGQIEGVGPKSAAAPSHRLETDASGRRKLIRRGYSAV